MLCDRCEQPLIEIDRYGERLTGCLECNSWRSDKRAFIVELSVEDVAQRPKDQWSIRACSYTVIRFLARPLRGLCRHHVQAVALMVWLWGRKESESPTSEGRALAYAVLPPGVKFSPSTS